MSVVWCSTCRQDRPAHNAREKVTCWTLSASGRGTMTSPQAITRSNIFECHTCFQQRIYGTPLDQADRPQPAPELPTAARKLRAALDEALDRIHELTEAVRTWRERAVVAEQQRDNAERELQRRGSTEAADAAREATA